MSGPLFQLPKVVPLSTSGTLLAGARLNFYAAGTSTRQDTYSDAALTTAHANPVEADAYGVFPPIYLNPASGAYKCVLTTSAEVVLYTVDDISATFTSATIALSLDSLIRTASEVAAGVTPSNYAFSPGDIRRYGAVGDGSVDDSAAITRAVSSGHPVFVPKGTFRILSALPLKTYLYLHGEGQESIIRVDANVSPFTNSTGAAVLYADIGDLTIRANTAITASALLLTDVSRSAFRNIVIDRTGGGSYFQYGIRLNAAASVSLWNQFSDIELTAISTKAVYLQNSANDNKFFGISLINSTDYSLTDGVHIESGTGNYFSGLTLEAKYVSGQGIRLDAGAVQNTIERLRTEGYSGTSASYAINWNGGTGNAIDGHYILGVSGETGTRGKNCWTNVTTVSDVLAEQAMAGSVLSFNGYPLTPDEGTYTATLTGCATSPTGTVRYVRHGNAVTVYLPSVEAASNSTAATLTGAPSAIRPARTQRIVGVLLKDNGVTNIGSVNIGTDGVMTFGYGPAEGAFTSSGTKGVFTSVIAYLLS